MNKAKFLFGICGLSKFDTLQFENRRFEPLPKKINDRDNFWILVFTGTGTGTGTGTS